LSQAIDMHARELAAESLGAAKAADAKAERADARAVSAVNGAATVEHGIGRVLRELGALHSKVDGMLDDRREEARERRRHREAIVRLTEAVRTMRPRVDSLVDLEEHLSELERAKARHERRTATLVRWGKRVALAAVIGAATTGGAALVAMGLEACGVHIPHLEIHP
jgi:hypothetical protein